MIRLEKFNKNAYATLISWVDSKELLMQFAGPSFEFPLTPEQLDRHLENNERQVFRVVNAESGNHIGHAEIFLTETSAYLSRILVAKKEDRGTGLGLAIVNQLLQIIFSTTDKNKAELNVFDWNLAAIRCYEKAGFTIHPSKRSERYINSETWVAINMFLYKEKWVSQSHVG
ncbi:MAG: GNAT family protein [Chitinophagaceae bacterium]